MFRWITSILDDWQKQGIIPGYSVAWLHDDRQELEVSGLQQTMPVPVSLRAGMLYDIASLTKVMGTTTVFLQAWATQKVALDMPINAILTDFNQKTTFRQALTHISALQGYIPHRDELSSSELKQALMTQLHTGPRVGRQVTYQDVNLLLVGWALETLYGDAIQNLITQRVLRPLDLPNATFAPDPRNCVPTTYTSETGLRRGIVHDPKSAILGAHSGSAGLFASLQDFVRFSAVMLSGQTSKTWPVPTSILTHDWTGSGAGRSIGWDLRQSATGRSWLYHTGFTGTFWLMDPVTKMALIVLTNRVHPQPDLRFLKVRDLFVPAFINAVSS